MASQTHSLQQNSSPPSTSQAALSAPSPQIPRWKAEGHLPQAGCLLPQDQYAPKQPPSPLPHALACSGSVPCVTAVAASGGSLPHLFNHFAVRFMFQNTNLASEVFNGSPPLVGRSPSAFPASFPSILCLVFYPPGWPSLWKFSSLAFLLCCYLLHPSQAPEFPSYPT